MTAPRRSDTDTPPPATPVVPAATRGDAAIDKRRWAAQARARTEAEREALLQSIVDYVDRERLMTNRLAEQSALLELAPDPIFVRDAERHITFWNAAAQAIYGFSEEEAVGQRPADLLRTEYPIPLEDIERAVEEDGYWEGDLVQTTRAGRRMIVASRWGAVYDDEGRCSALVEINRDITDRLEAQAAGERSRAQLDRERMGTRLVRAQRLESLGHLAGGIAHDFNNLLAVILGYSSVGARHLAKLAESADPDAAAALENDLRQITDASERAASLTRQLLAFARQDSIAADVVDVNTTIREMLELLRRTLGSHIELEMRLDAALDPVRIDPGQLGQVLINLAVNSRGAMPSGGRLLIETSRASFAEAQPLSHGVLPAGSYVRVRVNDSGEGMTREVVEHAFDPFFTTKPIGEGTGLGLATVYGIVSRAGGQVELHSKVGQGTTVTLLLPVADSVIDAPEPAAQPAPPIVAGAEILIAEDEDALRRVLVAKLSDAGYHATGVGNSEDALALAEDPGRRVDLLLTDIAMPGLLGQQLAERMLAVHPGAAVVFMSGFAHPMVPAGASALPAPLLHKPFTDAELLAIIGEQLTGR